MHKLLLLLSILFICRIAQGQKQESRLDSLVDAIFFEDDELSTLLNEEKVFHFLYFSSESSNKVFYAGREVGTDQYTVSGQVSYFNSKGIYFGVSGAWYSQLEPAYGTTLVTVGYSKSLKKFKNLSFRTSYNRYIYNNADTEYEPAYTGSLSIGATLKSSWIGSRLDFSFLMGNEFATNVSWSIYSKIKLYQFSRFNKIQFVPQFSIFFGVEAVEYESLLRNRMLTFTENSFGFMNAQVTLPIRVSYNNFDVELGYIYNMPRSLDPNYEYDNASSFNITLGYILDF